MPEEFLVAEKPALERCRSARRLSAGDENPVARHPAQERSRRRARQYRDQGRSVAAYEALLESARRHRPDAAIQGVLVSPMAKKGVEIIVGTMQDATFGPMIMVGLGGITTELFKDVIYRPAPVSAAEAARCSAS